MRFKKLAFKDINIKILTVEVIIISVIIFLSAYMIDKNDPFSLKVNINYFLILLTVVTLFYGIIGGLISLILSLPLIFYFYKPFPVDYFLFNFLIVLIMGEFHYYWSIQVRKEEEKSEYVEEKFNDLRRRFFFLKLSFDQIEKSYITKPVTIRSVVQEIKKLFALGTRPYEEFINILSQIFKIEKASLFLNDKANGSYKKVASVGESFELNLNDSLIQESLKEKTITYLPSILNKSVENNSEYLSVIPVFNSDNAFAIFVIKDIQFVEYNKENLLLIYLFIYYFFESIDDVDKLSTNMRSYIENIDVDLLIELEKLYRLWEKLKVESSLVVFNLDNSYDYKEFYSFIEDKIRNLDMLASLNDNKTIAVLLPFTSKSGCKSFTDKIESLMVNQFGKTYLAGIKKDIIMIDKDPELIISNLVKK